MYLFPFYKIDIERNKMKCRITYEIIIILTFTYYFQKTQQFQANGFVPIEYNQRTKVKTIPLVILLLRIPCVTYIRTMILFLLQIRPIAYDKHTSSRVHTHIHTQTDLSGT